MAQASPTERRHVPISVHIITGMTIYSGQVQIPIATIIFLADTNFG